MRNNQNQVCKKSIRRNYTRFRPLKTAIEGIQKGTLAFVKEPSAKEAFNDFWSGDTFKRAWANIKGGHPDPSKGVAYNVPSTGDNYVAPKKPKGCKVLNVARDAKGRPVSYACWR